MHNSNFNRSSDSARANTESPAGKQATDAARAAGLNIVTGPSGAPLGAAKPEPLADLGPEPVAMQPERLPAPERPAVRSLEEWDADDRLPSCCFCGKPCGPGEDGCHAGCLSDALNNFDIDDDGGELELADGLDLTIGDDDEAAIDLTPSPASPNDKPLCERCFLPLIGASEVAAGICYCCRHSVED